MPAPGPSIAKRSKPHKKLSRSLTFIFLVFISFRLLSYLFYLELLRDRKLHVVLAYAGHVLDVLWVLNVVDKGVSFGLVQFLGVLGVRLGHMVRHVVVRSVGVLLVVHPVQHVQERPSSRRVFPAFLACITKLPFFYAKKTRSCTIRAGSWYCFGWLYPAIPNTWLVREDTANISSIVYSELTKYAKQPGQKQAVPYLVIINA